MVSRLSELILLFIPGCSYTYPAIIRSMLPNDSTISEMGRPRSCSPYAQMWSANTYCCFPDTVLGIGMNVLLQD